MRKVLLNLLLIGWMPVAIGQVAGIYTQDTVVPYGQPATLKLVVEGADGPFQITYQRDDNLPETKIGIPNSPFSWGERITKTTTFRLLDVKNGSNKRITIDPEHGSVIVRLAGTGVEEDIYSPLVDIYPNPARDIINIDATDDELEKIEIFNINGQLKKRISASSASVVDVSDFSPGIYNILLFTKTGEFSSRRLIKQ